MDLTDALRARRMSRSFDGRSIDVARLAQLCEEALQAPTAGNAAGVSFVVFGADDVAAYLEVATDEEWRRTSRRAPGLSRAGAGVLALTSPAVYVDRYRQADKASSGLDDAAAWPVPYWHTDAAMATMALLLLVEQEQWAATLWGNFRRDLDVLAWADAPADTELFGSILVGYSDGLDHRSASLDRRVPLRRDRVRRLGQRP